MKIEKVEIKIRDLIKDYKDDKEGGVFAYDNKLIVRPSYQREFVYNDKQREAVINTVFNGFPLNIMYWNKRDENSFEILDGQQRTISICQYAVNAFSYKGKYYGNLTDDEKDKFKNYVLDVYICTGDESEKLSWFKVINIAGETLTDQELLNATFTGPFLASAKINFSKVGGPYYTDYKNYIKGDAKRQVILEKVLKWISDRDKLKDHSLYMAIHQHDKDDNDLWQYYNNVMNWAKMLFKERVGFTDNQEWGLLYNKYKDNSYNINDLEENIQKLLLDDEVKNKKGIIPYLLSDKRCEKFLNLRTFSKAQKLKMYENQKGICPICGDHFEINEMEADHKTPWSLGGKTELDNGQMLCKKCNREKSNK